MIRLMLLQHLWQYKASFDAWVHNEDFKLAHRNPMPKDALDGKGKLERQEVIICAEWNRYSNQGLVSLSAISINIDCILIINR